jgi:predicted Zn-dependent protease
MPIYLEDEASARRLHRVLWGALGGLVVLAVLGLWLGRPAYRHYKEKRFLAQAQQYVRKGDDANAALSTRLALSLNPGNVEATRIMVRLAAAARAPEELTWRQRMVDLEPSVAQHRLDLAKAAFVRGDVVRAQKALNGVDAASRQTAAYHELAGLLAVATSKPNESKTHLAEAARLDPENKRFQLNLAVLQLRDRDPNVAQEARTNLEQLSLDTEFRLEALRVLANVARRSNDLAGALAYASRLMADPAATLNDRLLHLSLLAHSKSPDFTRGLADLQKSVVKTPEQIYALAGWMISQRMAEEVLQWMNTLPAGTKEQTPVMLATADAHMAKKDWPALDALLQEREWDGLEFIRHGLQARTALEQGERALQETHWRAAVDEAGKRPRALATLVQMANAWRWTKEKESLLWVITHRLPRERWPLDELVRLYVGSGNTRGLSQVYAALLSRNAKDLDAQNDFAATALLLRTNLSQAQALAKKGYDQRPGHPSVSATYAYALHLEGKNAAALKVLEKLKPEELQDPSIAPYYGLILKASGATNQAKPYLELTERGRPLPEERAMVKEALKGL